MIRSDCSVFTLQRDGTPCGTEGAAGLGGGGEKGRVGASGGRSADPSRPRLEQILAKL